MRFYRIKHNTFHSNDFPWGQKVLNKPEPSEPCTLCEGQKLDWSFDIDLELEHQQGTYWPDILGNASSKFIVSESVISAWKSDGISELPSYRINISPPLPTRLENLTPPLYYWLDGKNMRGAKLDFVASGYVGVHFCPDCGSRSEDRRASHKEQRSRVCPYAFVEGSWNGEHLFTTDLSTAVFFCTEKVLECARKHKFTNFHFTPVEEGKAIGQKGIQYLE